MCKFMYDFVHNDTYWINIKICVHKCSEIRKTYHLYGMTSVCVCKVSMNTLLEEYPTRKVGKESDYMINLTSFTILEP